jgi:SNF2 family DNA or RNA helicase
MTSAASEAALRDVRELSPDQRAAWAERLRMASDARLPPLRYFNSAPCERHEALEISCRECGAELRPHQRTGILWLWLAYGGVPGGMLADRVGSGKTIQAAGLLALCKETGELGGHNRAVVVTRAPAVLQWARQLRRFLPDIPVAAVTGSMPRPKRVDAYLAPWEVLVISERTFASTRSRDGDVEILRRFPAGIVIADDIDALRTHKTQAARAVKALAAGASRRIDLNAEPLHKRVMELHSHLEFLGGNAVFGTAAAFRRNYVRTGTSSFYQRAMSCRTPLPCSVHASVVKGCKRCKIGHTWPQPAKRCPECGGQGQPDPTGRTVLRTVSTDIGIKNAEEFRYLLRPWVLRRKRFAGASYPAIQPNEIWVELTPRQRERYDELRRTKEVRRFLEAGEEVSRVKAAALFTRARQIASGTAALDEGQTDDSAKLDRVMRLLTGDLEDEKAVVFSYFKPNVAALSARLDAAGIGHVLMWSNETGAELRDERVQRFTNDPDCRVLVGTTTIAGSLDLQAARHLIAADLVPNPKVMTQIAGRVQRDGSAFEMVFFHQVLARGTVDEGLLEIVRREQGLSDAVWGERGDLFQGLSPADMLAMIAGEP